MCVYMCMYVNQELIASHLHRMLNIRVVDIDILRGLEGTFRLSTRKGEVVSAPCVCASVFVCVSVYVCLCVCCEPQMVLLTGDVLGVMPSRFATSWMNTHYGDTCNDCRGYMHIYMYRSTDIDRCAYMHPYRQTDRY